MDTQTIRLADLSNRYVDLKMKGTWGYVDHELKDSGFAMVTAESYIEEFKVEDIRCIDEDSNKLDVPVLIGTDRYGRELTVPTDKILAVGWLSTVDQRRLESALWLLDSFSEIPRENVIGNEKLEEMIEDSKAVVDELTAKGVRVYERMGR